MSKEQPAPRNEQGDRPEDVYRHCPHCQGRTKHVENEPPPEVCSHCGKSLLILREM